MNKIAGEKMTGKNKNEMNRRDLQAAERRQQLLNSAKELFAENGYAATPTRSINKNIGMADGLMYHYFPDGKLEILHTIATEGIQEMIECVNSMAQSLDADGDVKKELIKFLKGVYRSFSEHTQCITILAREQKHLEESHTNFLRNSFESRYSLVSAYLKKCHSNGHLPKIKYDLAAKQLLSIIFFFFMKNIVQVDLIGTDPDGFIEEMVDYNVNLWMK